jgi:mRNA-degrading endonuclease YafQ of YafQ-DinJ toxin-antitoxin module
MNTYKISFTAQFLRKYKKITKNNRILIEITKEKIFKLAQNPFNPSLKTHKYKQHYSTSITGDLRIIWSFSATNEIVILNFGGHEGKFDVYK